ncbi:MAG: sulfur carrier protein ThiS [Actinobacteria bacterium]|nr:sulfur carrier protein ThiS [Actinomycetota bacterium]
MRVVVNGDPRELPDRATVADAVAAAGAAPDGRGVAVAIDGEVVPRGRWEATAVEAEQRIEVLQAVQGG